MNRWIQSVGLYEVKTKRELLSCVVLCCTIQVEDVESTVF